MATTKWVLLRAAVGGSLALGLLASAAPAYAALPATSSVRAADGSTAKTTTTKVALSSSECQALGRLAPQKAGAILNDCYATVTMTRSELVTPFAVSAGTSAQVSTAALPPMNGSPCNYRGYQTYTYKWNVGVLYWVGITAKVEVDVCNNLQWDWVRPSWGTLFPITGITSLWYGAYPNIGQWYYYTDTNVGMDYVVSSPVSSMTGGVRWGFDPINMADYGVQQWGG
jgi:hypothetical protein